MKKRTLKIISALLIICMLVPLTFSAYAAENETSFALRYDSKQTFVRAMYPDYKAILNKEYSTTPVPGVEKTAFSDGTYAESMVPQGLCIAGDYLLVTAYDYEKNHNSVIYVMSNTDPKNRELVSTLELPDKNHVGGITFDGEYVLVARSTKKEVGFIKLTDIEDAAKSTTAKIKYEKKLKCLTTASFITYYDNKVWVGLYDEDNEATLQGYSMNESKTELTLECTATVPKRCQGAVFAEKDGKTYLVTSSSYGRNLTSYIRSYEVSFDGDKADTALINEFKLPPMTEELEICGDKLLIMTEAPATEYSTHAFNSCICPMDRISAADIDDIIAENDNALESLFNKIIDCIRALFGC